MTLRSLIVLAILSVLATTSAWSQLTIASTDPLEAAVNVPLEQKVVFNLSSPLPAFGSIFASKFIWSPTDSTTLSIFGHDLDGDGNLTVVFYTLSQTPNTDFSFFVYGVQADDGSTMERPFVLNYTTAPDIGPNTVSGTAALADRVPISTSAQRARVQAVIRDVIAAQRSQLGETALSDRGSASKSSRSHVARTHAAFDINKTVLLLLDDFETDERQWRVNAAAAIRADGSYSFDHVRDGTYVPLAINWADSLGDVINAYGFYDPNGDLDPDPIQVVGGNVTGVDLKLFKLGPTSAFPLAAVARERAATVANDQRLIEMLARDDADGGVAEMWLYIFYSPSQDILTYVDIDPINIFLEPEPSDEGGPILVTDFMRQQTPIPETVIDSDAAFQIAEANGGSDYRAQFADSLVVPVVVDGGDLDLAFRPVPGSIFWRVIYQPPIAGFEEMSVYVDMVTGEVLSPIAVANESVPDAPAPFTLHPNFPNPFTTTTAVRFDVAAPTPVRLSVFDLLGREVRTLTNGLMAPGRYEVTWDGTLADGQPAASGVYFYRLEASAFSDTRMMVLSK